MLGSARRPFYDATASPPIRLSGAMLMASAGSLQVGASKESLERTTVLDDWGNPRTVHAHRLSEEQHAALPRSTREYIRHQHKTIEEPEKVRNWSSRGFYPPCLHCNPGWSTWPACPPSYDSTSRDMVV